MATSIISDHRHRQLVGLHRAEFNRANGLYIRLLKIQIAIALIGMASIFITAPLWTYGAAVVAVGLAIWWAYDAWEYRRSRSVSERGRRLILLADGLGIPIPDIEWASLLRSFTSSEVEVSQNADPNYYWTKAPPGPQRLAEMLEESAFWSAELLGVSVKRSWLMFVGSAAIFLSLLFFAVPFVGSWFVESSDVSDGARVLCAMVTLLISTDFLGSTLAYMDSEKAVRRTLEQIQQVRFRGFPLDDVFLLVLDYSSAVESSPLFPPGIYEKHKTSIEKAWDSRVAPVAN